MSAKQFILFFIVLACIMIFRQYTRKNFLIARRVKEINPRKDNNLLLSRLLLMGTYPRLDPRSHSLKYQGHQRLEEAFRSGKGQSKHTDKRRKNGTKRKIYSDTTLRHYKEYWTYYCRYLKSRGIKCHLPEETIPYVQEYIDYLVFECFGRGRKHLSAWTVRAYFFGVAKVLNLSADDYDLPPRLRGDIRNCRGPENTYNMHPTEKQKIIIDALSCTGLRLEKEFIVMKGHDLIRKPDGNYYIHVNQGKGGRVRDAIIWGTPEQVARLVAMMTAAGDSKVFPSVSPNIRAHHLRGNYAKNIYLSLARPIEEIPREDQYRCKDDMAGIILDKRAMRFVSQQLGHNRIDVIAGNYLYDLDAYKEALLLQEDVESIDDLDFPHVELPD